MNVTLVDSNTSGIENVIHALSVCRDKVCTEDTVLQCLRAKPEPHLSMLEFMWFCFKCENIPIRVLWQLVRHRHFSFMVRSSRHVLNTDVVDTGVPQIDLLVNDMNDLIQQLATEDNDFTLDQLSWGQTMAHTTDFFLAGNGRVFYEYLKKRLCKKYVLAAHYNFSKLIYKELASKVPAVYNRTLLPCKACCRDCYDTTSYEMWKEDNL